LRDKFISDTYKSAFAFITVECAQIAAQKGLKYLVHLMARFKLLSTREKLNARVKSLCLSEGDSSFFFKFIFSFIKFVPDVSKPT